MQPAGAAYDGSRGPPRAGIGAQGAAQNPIIANLDTSGGSASASGERYSLFMSGIPTSLSDKRLQDILETVGPVLKVNRIKDASGKPKAFGFVEYGDPEAVLRCLEIVNGSSVVGAEGEEKVLAIKADAKVRAQLDEHEAGRMKTSQLEDQLAFAKDTLHELLASFKKNPSGAAMQDGGDDAPEGSNKYRVPAHLQDLGPEDLPEESRELVTREIAFFRERAAKREQANKAAEARRDSQRRENDAQRRAAGRPDYQDQRLPPSAARQQSPTGPRGPPTHPRQASPPGSADSRGFNRPVGFVPSSASTASPHSYGRSNEMPLSDEDAEKLRLQKKREHMDQQYRARLQAWEKRERNKLSSLEREKQDRLREAREEDRRRIEMLEKCAIFDDDEEAERGHELYIVDRARWRHLRKQTRKRELEQDARDAEEEARQEEALKKESENFLNRQVELFASMSGSKVDPNEPTKLKLAAPAPAQAKAKAEETKSKPKAPAAFGAADEDEENSGRKKRELIPLDYSDLDDEATKAEKRRKKLKELVDAIPNNKEELWQYDFTWDKMHESMIKEKLRPFVAKKSVEYLGSEEEEVIDTVLENMRAHKGPASLADELEPVLADEAEEFVIKVYRMLAFELLSALHGIKL